MKFLHSAALLRPPSGIVNQMRWESEVADELGLDWDTKLYCPKGSLKPEEFIVESSNVNAGKTDSGKPLDWLRFRFGYYNWLMSMKDAYDVLLLRYYVHDPFQLKFVRQSTKPVYFVHHTLEESELRLPGTLTAWFRGSMEHYLGPPTLRHSAGIVGVTQEILNYEIQRLGSAEKPVFVYPNGINFNEQSVQDKCGDVPELLFIASRFAGWHGLDLLLKSVENSSAVFKLHIVGKVNDYDLGRCKRDSRLLVHGSLTSEQIRYISESCWCGLSSFGLQRKKMREACTLKVREYLMMGLPVYSGHKDSGLPEDFLFYFIGDPCIEKILSYAHEVRNASREQIRSMSFSHISKKSLLKKLHSDISSQIFDANR